MFDEPFCILSACALCVAPFSTARYMLDSKRSESGRGVKHDSHLAHRPASPPDTASSDQSEQHPGTQALRWCSGTQVARIHRLPDSVLILWPGDVLFSIIPKNCAHMYLYWNCSILYAWIKQLQRWSFLCSHKTHCCLFLCLQFFGEDKGLSFPFSEYFLCVERNPWDSTEAACPLHFAFGAWSTMSCILGEQGNTDHIV